MVAMDDPVLRIHACRATERRGGCAEAPEREPRVGFRERGALGRGGTFDGARLAHGGGEPAVATESLRSVEALGVALLNEQIEAGGARHKSGRERG